MLSGLLNGAFGRLLALTGQAGGDVLKFAGDAWRYRQELMEEFPFCPEYWLSCPGAMPLIIDRAEQAVSLSEARGFERITMLIRRADLAGRAKSPRDFYETAARRLRRRSPILGYVDFASMSALDRTTFAREWSIHRDSVRRIDDEWLTIDWYAPQAEKAVPTSLGRRFVAVPLGEIDRNLIGFPMFPAGGGDQFVLFNSSHPVIRWALKIDRLSRTGSYGVQRDQALRLWRALTDPIDMRGVLYLPELKEHLEGWRSASKPGRRLAPPQVELLSARGWAAVMGVVKQADPKKDS